MTKIKAEPIITKTEEQQLLLRAYLASNASEYFSWEGYLRIMQQDNEEDETLLATLIVEDAKDKRRTS